MHYLSGASVARVAADYFTLFTLLNRHRLNRNPADHVAQVSAIEFPPRRIIPFRNPRDDSTDQLEMLGYRSRRYYPRCLVFSFLEQVQEPARSLENDLSLQRGRHGSPFSLPFFPINNK